MREPFDQRVPRPYVGSYHPRVDGRAKASGQAEYLDDVVAGMRNVLYAKVLRSPYPHARIKSMDTSKAEALPGVKGVLRYDDPALADLPATCCAWTSVNSASHDQMYYPNIRDHKILDSTVRWVGDEAGVVVAAESEAIADAALDLVEIEWEILPFVMDQYEALDSEAPIIHPDISRDNNILPTHEFSGGDVFIDKGDTSAALAEADVVVEATCQYHRADHSALDTRGCLVTWEGDKLTCWNNYYAPDQTRMYVSQMTGLPLKNVRVVNPYIGGNFGRCNMGEQSFYIFTALLAKKTGRPVRYKMTRREDFHDTRNAVNYWVKLGAKKDGTIVAADFKALGDTGAYHGHGMASVKLVVKWDVLENMMAPIPNLRYEGYVVYTNKIPGGCMRGIGNIQHNFAIGLAIDMLGEKLGMDPVEIAIKNYGHEWEPAPNKSVEAVFRTGAERIDWKDRHPAGQGPAFEGSKKRGVGFSGNCTWHAAWQEEMRGRIQAQIKLNPDMTVVLHAPMVETGVGSNSCVTFACADALSFLGTKPEDIHWVHVVDTETGLKDMIQTDSSCSYLQPELMPTVGAQLKEELISRAAALLEADPAEVDIVDGRAFVKADPERSKLVRDMLWFGDMVPVVVTVTQMPDATKTGAPFFATFAEVEVDTETGKVDVLRMVVVHDCGTVMYASGAEAQQIGSQTFGVGESLTEEIIYDPATGAPLNFNWVDYQLPTILDFPDVEPVLLEVWRGAGEYGASGMGEGASSATPRAIANAIYNAIGVRVDEIPIKPEKVLAALAKGEYKVPAPPTPGIVFGRGGGAMRPFEFVNASSLQEASELLEQKPGAAKAIAGGTDAFGTMKAEIHPNYPEMLINLKTVAGLDYIRRDGDSLAIGSLTRLHTLETDPVIRETFPALADAAHGVASPQLRNVGTIAGNICQEPRCWYYRYPDNYFECIRKGGANCNALTGENRFHSIFGSATVAARPCTGSCPASVEIPVYMERLRAGDVAGAAQILLEKNALPAMTGRVCPHTCEQECNRVLWDEGVSVRTAERYLGDYILDHAAEMLSAPPATGEPVAVIGGGPAGLSCAFYLRRAGHRVTVFEKMPEAGGMLRYGIPPYRLSIENMRRQVEALATMGIEFRFGVEAGKDIGWDELRDRYAACFLAPGAWDQPKLGLENEELLSPGLPFLREAKDGERLTMTGKVVVIGGGNVAVDVALTAKRLGADEVTMVCLEGDEEMPALSWEVAQARAAGVKILPSWGPGRILVENGRLTGLELVRCSCVFDASGRFNPTYDRDVTQTVAAGQVFLAIGQRADLSVIDPGEELRAGNWIKADEETQQTALRGVFAGGDVVSGPSTVIAAMAAGRRAAEAIVKHLGGSVAAAERGAGLSSFNSDFLAKTARTAAEEHGDATAAFNQEEASTAQWEQVEFEANRCFNCGCVAVTPSDLAPVLVALGAQMKTTSRILSAGQFFRARLAGSTALEPGELVEEIRLPLPAAGTKQAFSKFRIRKSIDFPIVNVAAVVTSEAGKVKEARVAMGAVAPVPVRAAQAEAYLSGKALTAETAREAAALAVAECIPLSRNDYKVTVLKTLVARALTSLVAEQ